ncbi:BTAD domain-containing putative transcriptional regulator [Streptomyces griseoviridis]|nr:BTAD domain-containing putative transcriptional regulator [Streptomyces niveoruber]
MHLDLALLGPLRVRHGGTDVPLGRPRHHALLAVLLAELGTPVSYERLVSYLWGDAASANAVAMLHVRMSQLRKALTAGGVDAHTVLVTTRAGYLLDVDPSAVDAHRFTELVRSARDAASRGDRDTAGALLREGLGLWRGRPFAEWADEPFARPVTTRLEALRLDASELRIEMDLASGEHESLVDELSALTEQHPLRERLWSHLMLARYRAGRQGEALETYRTARRVLLDEVGVEPGEHLHALHARMLRQDPSLRPARPAEPGTSPIGVTPAAARRPGPGTPPLLLTAFFGREAELRDIAADLTSHRLLTLVGPGGAGKSRLALEAASRVRVSPARGVVWAELAELGPRERLVDALAAKLGPPTASPLPAFERLARVLEDPDTLLVLDNAEHRLSEVAQVSAGLLARVAGLRILITSRQRLGVGGERVVTVGGLPVADPDRAGVSAAVEAASVRLFSDRAGLARGTFRLTESNLADVVAVCERVDGLPLAIELAAANTRSLDVTAIAARLARRPDILRAPGSYASDRHRTLQSVISWSHDSLSAEEQRLFAHLSVFGDRFDVAAVEAVCAGAGTGLDEHDVVDVLAGLVEKSMVTVHLTDEGPYRYRLLRIMRAFAAEKLRHEEAHTSVRERHRAYFTDFAEEAGHALREGACAGALDRLETEYSNICAALEWSVSRGEATAALRLAGSLVQFWDLHGRYAEGRRWLEDVLAIRDDGAPTALRGYALAGSACLATIQGDLEAAERACDTAEDVFAHLGDAEGATYVLINRGLIAVAAQRFERAEHLLRRASRQAAELRHGWLQQWALVFDTMLGLDRAWQERATAPRPAGPVVPSSGDPKSVAWLGVVLAGAEQERGRPAEAAAHLRESCRLFDEMEAAWGLSVTFLAVGRTASRVGDHRRASRLLGASERLRRSVGADCWPVFSSWRAELETEGREALGTEQFLRVRQAGAALDRSQAVALALRDTADDGQARRVKAGCKPM